MRVAVVFLGKRGGGGRYTLELSRALAKQNALNVHLLIARGSILREIRGTGIVGDGAADLYERGRLPEEFYNLCWSGTAPRIRLR